MLGAGTLAAAPVHAARKRSKARPPASTAVQRGDDAERRWLAIQRADHAGQTMQAIALAQALVRDYPTFDLARLTLHQLQAAPGHPWIDAPEPVDGFDNAQDLRAEAAQRLHADRARPRPGTLPMSLLQLPAQVHHAIAVDVSLSRLYLFENTAASLRLVADDYASTGAIEGDKQVEGDQRTPRGVYFTTGRRPDRTLPPFYGAGALVLNYPNALDALRGKTGSGIWLHGTPPGQYARAPSATDGCVVLANPGMRQLLGSVDAHGTPVVIAQTLDWRTPQEQRALRKPFAAVLDTWARTRSRGDLVKLLDFYAPDFRYQVARQPPLSRTQREQVLRADLRVVRGRELRLHQCSLLHHADDRGEIMVATFAETIGAQATRVRKRQYWVRAGGGWQILFEGVIG